MRKLAFYAEKSLIETDDFFDVNAKNGNRDARDASGYLTRYGFNIDNNGVCIITVNDELVAEYGWYGIDYKTLGGLIERAEEDKKVDRIVLDINSPGGSVSGLFDLCEQIRNCDKPIYAYTSGYLASAAYTIASATRGIYAIESAAIGSVGVFMSFYDDSEWLKKNGIKEISFYGRNSDKKNLDPESKEGKEVYQAEINELEEILIKNIANYRGVTTDEVLENFGHGLMFRGNEALSRGMIDGVVTDFDSFIEHIAESNTADGGTGMAKTTENVVLASSVEAIDPEFLAQIQAEAAEKARAEEQAKSTEQANSAVAAERARVAALERYASLPQAEIKAMAEKAKADGISVAEFEEQFKVKAFELFQKNEFASASRTPKEVLAEEATESASLEAEVEQDGGQSQNEKSDMEKGKELAASLKARLNK